MSTKVRVVFFALLLAVVSAMPVFAGSAVVGSVAGSLNATVGGQALLPNGVIFSGDHLQVKDGAAVVALENGSRMAFGRNTEAEFNRDATGVAVKLADGNVSIYHPAAGTAIRVTASNYTITPGQGYKSVGEVAMLNGLVVVTAKSGTLDVNGAGRTMQVAQGKTVTLSTNPARAPQTGASQKLAGGGNTALEAGALGAGALAAVLAGIGISRANDAKNAASAANAQASSAASSASAANSGAAAATSAATAAGAAANAAGCALNTQFNPTATGVSPYTPPTGFTCP